MLVRKEGTYPQGTRVKVHSFGDGHEGFGTICGVASGNVYPSFCIYIIEMDRAHNPWASQMTGYKCLAVPNSCLDLLIKENSPYTDEQLDPMSDEYVGHSIARNFGVGCCCNVGNYGERKGRPEECPFHCR